MCQEVLRFESDLQVYSRPRVDRVPRRCHCHRQRAQRAPESRGLFDFGFFGILLGPRALSRGPCGPQLLRELIWARGEPPRPPSCQIRCFLDPEFALATAPEGSGRPRSPGRPCQALARAGDPSGLKEGRCLVAWYSGPSGLKDCVQWPSMAA